MNHVDNPFQSSSVLSLCTGMRGPERGLERVIGPLNIAAFVEVEAFIIANLLAGMESGVLHPSPIWTDVKTFDAQPFYKKIHGIIGGYPCQPFSQNGKRRGQDDPRHLYPFISKAISIIKPAWCFFENVEGHLTCGFDFVCKDLQSMGYAVEAVIYSAEEVGATHARKRLVILALADSYRSGGWQDWQPGELW